MEEAKRVCAKERKLIKRRMRTGTTAALLECGMRERWRISWVPWWKILVLPWIELTATSSQTVVISLMKKTRDRKSLKHSALISNPALPSSLSKIRSYVQGPILFFEEWNIHVRIAVLGILDKCLESWNMVKHIKPSNISKVNKERSENGFRWDTVRMIHLTLELIRWIGTRLKTPEWVSGETCSMLVLVSSRGPCRHQLQMYWDRQHATLLLCSQAKKTGLWPRPKEPCY